MNWTKEIQAMVECVAEAKLPLVSGTDGREAARHSLAAVASAEEHNVVDLEQP